MSPKYSAKDITVLEGLEPVRKRPGMYIGGTGSQGLHHLLWEVVDNAVDEAINGFASVVTVTLHSDCTTCTVQDNGRGIPVDIHPSRKVSALEVILTTLHAGGKFDAKNYRTSGGLHGVGASVVNALSAKLTARVRRDGIEYIQYYKRGVAKGPVEEVGPARGSGTTITFSPDPLIFEEIHLDPQIIFRQLEIKSFLHRGMRVIFRDQVNKKTHDLQHDGGLSDFLSAVLERDKDRPVLDAPFYMEKNEDDFKVEVALTWTESPTAKLQSFVNGIPTADGGTHEQGLRDGLVRALRSFMDAHQLAPKNLTLTADDIREGTSVILSVLLTDPQFQGQTKDKLNNTEAKQLVDSAIRPAFEQWLHDNKSRGEAIVLRATQSARARVASRQAATAVRRKSVTSSRLNLPGKLSDCSSSDPSETEIFIVEGDSAGGSAKQGRDRKRQAILPLRGKVLNAEQANMKKILSNEELKNIITALGTGLGDDMNLSKLRYGRIILLMDADTDGHHITTLLLTFLYRCMRPLIEGGFIYIAQPPLYRINVGKNTWWAQDDASKEKILASLPSRAKPEITRFKGLGEMPPKTLFNTTLNPATRRLIQVTVPDAMLANLTVSQLMGKDPAPRYRILMEQAENVEMLDV
jgi:DNA gyrase subunit B/topoisomerase-4 subunit B